jgi:hypothetical protein
MLGNFTLEGVWRRSKEASRVGEASPKVSGGDLLSQGVATQVPSALEGLTSVFGMGTGVTPLPLPPETCILLSRVRILST